MQTEAGETGSTQSVPDQAVSRADPIELARLLLRQLAAVPWVGLGAIGTGFGIALLAFYFRSIDFIPPDIPSILSASVFVALLAVAFYLCVLVSAGSMMSAGLVLVLLGGAGWTWSEWKTKDIRPTWWKRLPSVLWVCFWSVLPIGALLALLWPSQGAGWAHLAALSALWLGIVVAPAFLRGFPIWGCALIVTTTFPALAFSLPALLGSPSLFPTKVAELAGIRSTQRLELRVPMSTCLLIESALGAAPSAPPVKCDGHEWGSVHAQVLANLGPRWLIQLSLTGAEPQADGEVLRLTVPGEGVHIIQRPSSPRTSGVSRCQR